METLGTTKQSRLEKLIGSKIKKAKPKHAQPGYIKKLVEKQFNLIEDALNRGCDFDDIADVISEEIKRSVSAATLQKYHLANRRTLQENADSNEDSTTNTANNFLENEHPVEITQKKFDNTKLENEKHSIVGQSKNERLIVDNMSPSSNTQDNSLKNRLRDRVVANSPLVAREEDNLDSNMFEDDEDMAEFNLY